jgi:molybdate transport system ATP-binding protein
VTAVEPVGERVRVRVDGPLRLLAEVTPAGAESLSLQDGKEIWCAVKATEIDVYPA